MSPQLDIFRIEEAAAELALGTTVEYRPVVGSTNALARELATSGASPGTLVLTDFQDAGRGRQGRIWQAKPNQDLTFSLILKPTFAPSLLTMACSVAIATTLERLTAITTLIKWPNDVLIHEKKISGILIETDGTVTIAGMGINVGSTFESDPELKQRATSLAELGATEITRENLLIAVLRELSSLYVDLEAHGESAAARLRMRWIALLETLGRNVTVNQHTGPISGFAESVEDDGALVLRLPDGTREVIRWGDVL